jgi:hypothetical protein
MSALAALGLPASTQLIYDEITALAMLDDPTVDLSIPVVILTNNTSLLSRFPAYEVLGEPSAQALNIALPERLMLARHLMLRNQDVPHHITEEVDRQNPPVVVMLLVDGLSYEDVRDWGWSIQPCLVDGPSVTYRLDRTNPLQVNPNVGFAALVGTPPLAMRLRGLGFKQFRGFSYWQRGQNTVSDMLFQYIPTRRVQGFGQILAALREEPIQNGTYLQIMREGLDGLAHGKRELGQWEIDGAAQAILHDIEALLRILPANTLVYVTADHGMLWKHEHRFEPIPLRDSRPRYTETGISEMYQAHSSNIHGYDVLHYPYLGAPIPTNDSGVHGGLSYQESVVPFITIKV